MADFYINKNTFDYLESKLSPHFSKTFNPINSIYPKMAEKYYPYQFYNKLQEITSFFFNMFTSEIQIQKSTVKSTAKIFRL